MKLTWVHKNIDEIARDPVLRVYGALLAATHILTFYFWHESYDLASVLGPGAEPICWPFWEDCWKFRFHDMASLRLLLWSYCGLSLVPIVLFARRQWAALAWWSLLVLNIVKLAILAQDFQLRMNQHYMAGVASAAFLLVPKKRDTLQIVITLFYFWAGLLKLNYEWLSGATIDKTIWFFKGPLEPVACAYVVLLEVVLVWGIFSRRAWLFWLTLGQLILFQWASWQIVSYYYPLLMFALLTIYPMSRLFPPTPDSAETPASNPLRRFIRGEESRAAYGFVALLCLLQVVPVLFPGDSTLTGEGRMFTIHMFDAAVQCEPYVMLKRAGGSLEHREFGRPLPQRIRCDPIVFLNRGRALCRSPERGKAFDDFDLHLDARKSTGSELRPIIAVENFCATDPSYDLWRHNWWIHP